MKTHVQTVATGDVVYLLVFGLYLILATLDSSFYRSMLPLDHSMNAVLLVLLFVLALRELLYEAFSGRSLALLCAAGFLCANALITGTMWMAFPFLLMYAGRNVSQRLLLSFAACLSFLLLFFVIGSSLTGLIPNYLRRELTRSGNREFLGFLYALYPGTYLFNAAACLLAVRGRRIRFISLFLIMALNLWIYRRTDGRFSFLLLSLLLAAFAAAKLYPALIRRARPLFLLSVPAFALCGAVSLYLTAGYDRHVGWMSRLNALLGKRLLYGRTALDLFGAGPIGRRVRYTGFGVTSSGYQSAHKYLYVDNLYVSFFQRFGWIAGLLALLLLTAAVFLMYRAGRYELLIIFALLALHALVDDQMLCLYCNTFWITAVHALMTGGQQGEEWDYESIA